MTVGLEAVRRRVSGVAEESKRMNVLRLLAGVSPKGLGEIGVGGASDVEKTASYVVSRPKFGEYSQTPARGSRAEGFG